MIQQYIIYIMAFIILSLGGYSVFQKMQKEQCQLNSKVASELAKYEMEENKKQLANYDKILVDITTFYDGEIDNINQFAKDSNETECDSAYRILRTFKY